MGFPVQIRAAALLLCKSSRNAICSKNFVFVINPGRSVFISHFVRIKSSAVFEHAQKYSIFGTPSPKARANPGSSAFFCAVECGTRGAPVHLDVTGRVAALFIILFLLRLMCVRIRNKNNNMLNNFRCWHAQVRKITYLICEVLFHVCRSCILSFNFYRSFEF